MISRTMPLVLGLCMLAAAGCEPPDDKDFRFHNYPIINGSPDTDPAHRAVVVVYDNGVGAMCTGTVISRRVVLTAAHCVGSDDMLVGFGTDVDNVSWLGVVDQLVHPQYSESQLVNDLALLRLSADPIGGVDPIPALPYSLRITTSDIGDPLEYVGFGATSGSGSGSGTKLTMTNDLEWICDSASCSGWYNPGHMNTICQDQSPSGLCVGDSGGPAFIVRAGQEYVAGVASYVGQGCTDFGCSTKVDQFESFIASFTSGANGTPCGTGAECDSGHCVDGVCCNSACTAVCQACDVPGSIGTCRAAPNGWECADDNPCNGDETCQSGSCVAGTPPDCDDHNVCTNDGCLPASGCIHNPVADGTDCADDVFCDGEETCQDGVCRASAPPDCSDGDPCTRDACHPVDGCVHTTAEDGTQCFDDDVCNGAELCRAGVCQPGTPIDCDDHIPCTVDGCNRRTGCSHQELPDDSPCDDGNLCTDSGSCLAGVCRPGPALDCDDHNMCTSDSCVPATGCRHEVLPDGTSCGGGVCGEATCTAGVCMSSDPESCDDGDPCTRDWCDPDTGCGHDRRPDGYACGDCLACVQGQCVEVEGCKDGGCGCGTPVDAGAGTALPGMLLLVALLAVRRRPGREGE